MVEKDAPTAPESTHFFSGRTDGLVRRRRTGPAAPEAEAALAPEAYEDRGLLRDDWLILHSDIGIQQGEDLVVICDHLWVI